MKALISNLVLISLLSLSVVALVPDSGAASMPITQTYPVSSTNGNYYNIPSYSFIEITLADSDIFTIEGTTYI